MRKFIYLLLVLAFLIACSLFYTVFLSKDNFHTPEKPRRLSSSEIVVGWIGPLTGPAKVLGTDNLKAIQLAFWEYSVYKDALDTSINLVVADDQYDAEKTEEKYKEMVSKDRPSVIFISTYSGLVKIANLALQDKILLIDSTDNDLNLANLNHNIFLIAKETEGTAAIYANSLIEQRKNHTAIFFNKSDDFMTNLSKTLAQILQKADKNATLYEYDRETKDFLPLLQSAQDEQADAYVFFGYVETGNAIKKAREMGITAPIYSVNLAMDPIFQQNAKEAVEGVLFTDFTLLDAREESVKFLRDYKQKYNANPAVDWIAMQAYDAANILIQAIKESGEVNHNYIEILRKNMLQTNNYYGVTGIISIQPSGSSKGIYPSLYMLKDGKQISIHKYK